MNSIKFNDMIVFRKYQTYSEPTIRHSGVNIYWQEQLERSLTTGRLNEISQWKTTRWKILCTFQPIWKQLLSIYSKWTENEEKSTCPKQRNIAQDLAFSANTSL
ncbi:hypothetical protein T01_2571 [Trichinella spiralis]|uniref:Uncharacterized protein n=1 Tax=Trichinella spiralis TaxID=6334 RepID=A0A0V1AL87_TRISP|nr:hypothetical protein T01_2571 [Trichinella spiralis]